MKTRVIWIAFAVLLLVFLISLSSTQIVERHYFIINEPLVVFIDPSLSIYRSNNAPIQLSESPKNSVNSSPILESGSAYHWIPDKKLRKEALEI